MSWLFTRYEVDGAMVWDRLWDGMGLEFVS